MLLAVTCPVCGAPGRAPCPGCAEQLLPAAPGPVPPGVDACLALLSYEGAGRELVARLKYRNHRSLVPGLAAAMASLVAGEGSYDAVTWIPTTPARRRRRGFDQAELLARAVARHLRLPAVRLLVRGPGLPQTGRTLADRRAAPRFRPLENRRWPAILLVDDVVTTGSTAGAAAGALRSAGARSVTVLAAARTPRLRRPAPVPTGLA